jgi:hypothetical protein
MKTPTNDRKPNKGKEQDHLKKTSLGPLRQGQRFDTSETKQNSSKERKPPNQSSNTHKELPLHTCKLPLNQCNSPWTNACKPLENSAAVTTSAHTGQTGHHHRSDRCQHAHRTSTLTGQTDDLDRSDRCTPEPRKLLETTWKPSKCIQQAISSSNFSPLLVMHESSQKCKTLNLELLKYTKFNKGCYTCPNRQVKYSIASYRHQLKDHRVSQLLDEAKMDLGNFAKNLPLMSKVLNMIKTYQNGKAIQTSC